MQSADLTKIAEALSVVQVPIGTDIVTQGQTGDTMYILENGTAVVDVEVKYRSNPQLLVMSRCFLRDCLWCMRTQQNSALDRFSLSDCLCCRESVR